MRVRASLRRRASAGPCPPSPSPPSLTPLLAASHPIAGRSPMGIGRWEGCRLRRGPGEASSPISLFLSPRSPPPSTCAPWGAALAGRSRNSRARPLRSDFRRSSVRLRRLVFVKAVSIRRALLSGIGGRHAPVSRRARACWEARAWRRAVTEIACRQRDLLGEGERRRERGLELSPDTGFLGGRA